MAQTPEATEYRPRTEGMFARVIHHHDGIDDYWEVRTRDGLIALHGTPGRAGDDPAVTADPAQRANRFAWNISESRDVFGNRVVYEYERDLHEDGARHWDQLYLKRIRQRDELATDTRLLAGRNDGGR